MPISTKPVLKNPNKLFVKKLYSNPVKYKPWIRAIKLKCNVTDATLHFWREGKSKISARYMQTLADILEVDVLEIFPEYSKID